MQPEPQPPHHPTPRSSNSALRPGERIGAYRVERQLGRGGMGEVYLAFDDRLGRLVAIKRIRHDGPLSEVQRERFRREARAAARLNHPAIVQIFDLITTGDSDAAGASGAGDALVMEYVEGESLADLVARGPLDPAVAVRFAREIALGLGAAHAAGFVHRDLKTENVMATASGAVKILDFGLVKSIWQRDSQGDEQSLTAEGIVLGTFHTISPEQVRGGEADARSDLFSLGVLLYELLTGQSPFRGGSHVESLRRILTYHPPPLATICPALPRELGALVERLLEKDPRRRPQTARDVAAALGEIAALPGFGGPGGGGGFASTGEETLSDRPTSSGAVLANGYGEAKAMSAEADAKARQPSNGAAGRVSQGAADRASAGALAPVRSSSGRLAESEAGTGASPVSVTRKLLLRLAAAALVVAAAVGVYLVLRTGPGKAPPVAPAQAPVRAAFTQLTDFVGSESSPSISPDGSFFLYGKASGGKSHIYLQRVGGTNSIDLSRDSPASDTQPAFSADGQQIAFRSERDGGGIFLMGAMGESVRRLTDFGFSPAWSPDGSEVVCATAETADPARRNSASQLWRVNVATGAKRLVVEGDALQPSWSPHGRRIAYWRVFTNSHRALYTVPADRSAPVGAGEAVPVVDDQHLNWSPAWAPDGKHLYFASDRGGSMNLWRVAIDETTGKALGEPEALTTPSRWSGLPSIARDGRRIAYETRDSKSTLEKIALDPVAARTVGPLQVLLQSSRYVRSCEVSPDGHWIAFHSQVPQEDLFIVRSDGSNLRQLTNDSYKDRGPVWSPDGSRIAFYSDRTGLYKLWTIRPDGGGLEQVLGAQGPVMVCPIWSPDGRQLAGTLADNQGTALIDLARPQSERVAAKVPVAAGHGNFYATAWSPDGRWLSGEFLPPGKTTRGVALYSFASHLCSQLTERGHNAHWLHDSRRLVYLDEGKLFWVDSRTRRPQLMLEPPADSSFVWVSIDPADRLLYLVRQSDEGHIWMLTLG